MEVEVEVEEEVESMTTSDQVATLGPVTVFFTFCFVLTNAASFYVIVLL